MNVYSARQSIFNRKLNVIAYELFFRSGENNFYPAGTNDHDATSKLISRTHFNKGLVQITSGKPALINFSEESLIKGLPLLLNPQDIMIEILETVTPSDEIYEICRDLYKKGYSLALDDFIYKKEWKRFLKLVKVIKFDIMETPLDKIAPLITQLREKTKIKLLAEKIETNEEFEKAKKMGFHFFQGYFFCKPEMKKTGSKQITNEHLLTQLYQEAISKNLNLENISNLFNQDSSLTYKLLLFVNSGLFPLKNKISSVKQSLTYLGDEHLKRLILLIVTSSLASNKPAELMKVGIIRAKCCEQIMNKVQPKLAEQSFLTGMLSTLDAILDSPMDVILDRLTIEDEICDSLLKNNSQSHIAIALRVIKYLEKGSWHLTEQEANKLNLDYKSVSLLYNESIQWADKVLSIH
jgi:EAL and modified HD-GYP domain-containing signal transduction protein